MYIRSKAKSFLFLLREVRGVFARLKFCGAILGPTAVYEIPFASFTLTFSTGQGELTPYQEIKEDLARAIPDRSPCRDWVVIDGGANIGLFSLFLKEAKHIIAIEPNPGVAGRLTVNFQKNRLRGIVLNQALSATEGPMMMSVSPNTSVLSKLDTQGNLSVLATTIDRLVEKYGLSVVDLLKLDLEGHEPEALAGASKSLARGVIKRVYAEFNDPAALKKLDELLIPLHFNRTTTLTYNALYEHPRD